jgi:tRNA (cytidine/uridine-2'-O-)-methyltransferase
MFHLILYRPEIPPNTGNIIRLCANSGFGLHLVRPLGFELDDRQLRRAGLDYHEYANLTQHDSLDACVEAVQPERLFAFSTRGTRFYTEPAYRPGDALLFGPETSGLPDDVLNALPEQRVLRIPLRPGNRSLNLSNAAAVAVYEVWRQNGFGGGD